jgi:transglutaminase-like putative cysteine protease
MPYSVGPAAGNSVALVDTLPISNNGLDAVRKTLKLMAAIVRKYRSDVTTLNAATGILRANGITDMRTQKRQAINILQAWVRDHIAYFYDPRETELVRTPPETLTRGVGDCDDKTVLLLAMLEAVGFTTQLLAVGGEGRGWDPDCVGVNGGPPAYSHVLGAVQFGPQNAPAQRAQQGWLTVETIVAGKGPGWKPPGIKVIMPWRI